MDNWRRQRGESYNSENTRTRSQNRKPPNGNWQPTVPTWEKEFCYSVGSVPWRKVVEIKNLMHLYNRIVEWNDSAGEEAFNKAKSRFYAQLHNLPCDISLPDPNIYLDELDWDSKIDPELILDLERDPEIPDPSEKHEQVLIWGDDIYADRGFSCTTGWGDAEDDLKKVSNYVGESSIKRENVGQNWNKNSYGRREGSGRYMSRYKTSRFTGEDYQQGNNTMRNGNARKRANFVSEKPGWVARGNGWSFDKPVP